MNYPGRVTTRRAKGKRTNTHDSPSGRDGLNFSRDSIVWCHDNVKSWFPAGVEPAGGNLAFSRNNRFNPTTQSMNVRNTLSLSLGLAAILAVTSLPLAAADLKAGDVAPDFQLQGSDGKTYKLSDFKGKETVVLAWFPKAFTPGCTAECKSFHENGGEIRKFKVAYFTASVDKVEGEKGNKKFAESLNVDFPILSDPTSDTARAYGVVTAERKVAQRWTYYIGTDGKILYVDKAIKTGTAASDVAARLKELGVAAK